MIVNLPSFQEILDVLQIYKPPHQEHNLFKQEERKNSSLRRFYKME